MDVKCNDVTPKWYVINTVVGYEAKAASWILEEAKKAGMSELIADVVAPIEDKDATNGNIAINKVESKSKKKLNNATRGMFPGYFFIKMQLTDSIVNLISECRYALRFLGDGKNPTRIPESQMRDVIQKIGERSAANIESKLYSVRDVVKIIEGPFTSFSAIVESIDEVKKRLKLKVSIFGRSTSVDLEFSQVEKIVE